MKVENITINSFMRAWFGKDYSELSKEDFDEAYSEYIDLAGLYSSKEFELFTYINYLKNTIYTLKCLVAMQTMYVEEFHKPFLDGLDLFEKNGFKITWDGSEKKFMSQLKRVSGMVRAKELDLKNQEFEFGKLKEVKKEEVKTETQTRHEFIKMLNSFNKQGFHIDRDKTTIEELALIIKQLQDESAKLALSRI